jgi:hypothetical protein
MMLAGTIWQRELVEFAQRRRALMIKLAFPLVFGIPLVVAEPENATAKAVRELAVAVPGVLRPRSGAERIKKPLAVI